MEELIKATAWRMTPPSAYGSFHLSFFLIGLLVSLGLAILLRRTTDRQNKVVLLVCGLFLVLSEIYKHLFYYYVVGEGSYPWWIFPFQLCSVPMYICLIAPFLKKGGVQQALYNFMISYNFLGGLCGVFRTQRLGSRLLDADAARLYMAYAAGVHRALSGNEWQSGQAHFGL